jgi:hypothetical protein
MTMESFDYSLLIPILSITFGIGAGVVSMVLRHRRRQQLLDIYHKERLAAIECGMLEMPELPPALLNAIGDDNSRRRDGLGALLAGLVLLFGGIALAGALYAVAGGDVAMFGLIPAAVGLANLVFVFIVRRTAEKTGAAGAENALPPSAPR